MSRNWYLSQNADVRESGIQAFLHFIKYGRKELRNWWEPRWFKKALGSSGWVWSTSKYFFDLHKIDHSHLKQNYKEIYIYRPGLYKEEIKKMKSTTTKSFL